MSRITDFMLGRPAPATSPSIPPAPPVRRATHEFAIGDDYSTWRALVAGVSTATVSRVEAMRVPSVRRARNLICGVPSTLPLHVIRDDGTAVDRSLLTQPEKAHGYTRSHSIAWTADDLFFESSCLWRVLDRDSTKYPTVAQRIPHGQWSQDADSGVITCQGEELDQRDAILFLSPDDPFLESAAATVRIANLLRDTAKMYADSPEASEYFTTREDEDVDNTEVVRFLSDYLAARKRSSSAYLPGWLERHEIKRMTSDELQLIDAQTFIVKEIARLSGTPSDWLSVEVTSHTYQNIVDERRSWIDFSLSPAILTPIEQRLSLGDVTPNGQRVKFNLDAFLRANTKERYETYQIGLTNRFLTLDEVRGLEDRQPFGGTEETNV